MLVGPRVGLVVSLCEFSSWAWNFNWNGGLCLRVIGVWAGAMGSDGLKA